MHRSSSEQHRGGIALRLGRIEQGRKKYSNSGSEGLPHMLLLCLLCYAWEALGQAPGGGGLEMGQFGHVFEKPSHVEGRSSMPDFAICVNRALNITKEVPDCGWLQLSRDEKSIRTLAGRGCPIMLCLLACFACYAWGES